MSSIEETHTPLAEAIFDGLHLLDVEVLPGLLEQWKSTEFSDFMVGAFFMSACNRRHAPIVNILVQAGLRAPSGAIALAISRHAWETASALLLATDELSLVKDEQHLWRAPLLVDCILANQHELARAQLPLYSDPPHAANVALHNLTRLKKRTIEQAATAVGYLLQAGADPNYKAIGNTPPLEAALVNGHTSLALALLDAGARLDEFSNPLPKIVHCAYARRDLDADADNGYRFSEGSWRLFEIALENHLTLPRLIVSGWGSQYFEGFDKFSGQISPKDIPRLLAMTERMELGKSTPTTTPKSASPRL